MANDDSVNHGYPPPSVYGGTNPYAGYYGGLYSASQGMPSAHPSYGAYTAPMQQPSGTTIGTGAGGGAPAGMPQHAGEGLPLQQSYIENILRLNEGKVATVYMSFEAGSEWSSKVFKGTVEAAGKDHIILKDIDSEKRYLLLMIYLDYVTFEEELNYAYPPAQYFG